MPGAWTHIKQPDKCTLFECFCDTGGSNLTIPKSALLEIDLIRATDF